MLEDANHEKAIKFSSGGCNCGQSCCAVEEFMFTKKFMIASASLQKKQKLIIEEPTHDGYDLGPLADQINYLDKQLEDAVSKGANYLVKPRQIPIKGNYFHR